MGLYKRGDIWHYSFTHPKTGKQVRKSAETTNRRRAETLAAKELTDAANQTEEVVENQTKKVPVTMGQLFERFMYNVSSHFKETTHAMSRS
jgi:hypothetical protein